MAETHGKSVNFTRNAARLPATAYSRTISKLMTISCCLALKAQVRVKVTARMIFSKPASDCETLKYCLRVGGHGCPNCGHAALRSVATAHGAAGFNTLLAAMAYRLA